MNLRVIGTAGHVDHGKSTLVEALTGINPDRLKEEREREMTIDLGFAWMSLPGGEEVGIIDVPGHRDFIENMLAGVGGIDAALFVVAADEGIMPQTREHLAILDLLSINRGVVALTKVDLVGEDETSHFEWLTLVEEELRQVLAGTALNKAPIVRVSARTRFGITELIQSIETCLKECPQRPDLGRPRLPVDRIFIMPGFGTVVTGTLLDGQLMVGEELQILPKDTRGRIRGLQSHQRKENIAVPGSRTAVNISGVDVDQIQRGNVIAHPGDYMPTRRLDVYFRLLREASQSLLHDMKIKMYLGSAQVVARVRLLGTEKLDPGQEGWLQLELEDPVVAVKDDRFILRRPSPGETLGGGIIVDPHPEGRHKRFNSQNLDRLNTLKKGSPQDVVLHSLKVQGVGKINDLVANSNLDKEIAYAAITDLYRVGQLVDLDTKISEQSLGIQDHTKLKLSMDDRVTSKGFWDQLAAHFGNEVKSYHIIFPLRPGIPREELKSRLKAVYKSQFTAALFNVFIHKLVEEGSLIESGAVVFTPGFTIQFSPDQKEQIEALLTRFKISPYAPPTAKECLAVIGEEVFNALVELEKLVFLPPVVVFRKEDYDQMVLQVIQLIEKHGEITTAQVRDYFNTSRRYVLAFLEHLDARGITIRNGDFRKLKKILKN